MTTGPSCPRCGLADRVMPLDAPVPHKWNPNPVHDWPWECGRCVLMFTGTPQEWDRMRPARVKYRDDHGGRTAVPR